MKYSQHVLFADKVEPDDDIDELFSQLSLIRPPDSLIDDIMASVHRLSQTRQQSPSPLWEDMEDFIVHHEHCEPS